MNTSINDWCLPYTSDIPFYISIMTVLTCQNVYFSISTNIIKKKMYQKPYIFQFSEDCIGFVIGSKARVSEDNEIVGHQVCPVLRMVLARNWSEWVWNSRVEALSSCFRFLKCCLQLILILWKWILVLTPYFSRSALYIWIWLNVQKEM